MISACENVCRDFSFLSRVGDWVYNFGPAIALVGAVVLFFLQRRYDRAEALRVRRLEVYQETIVALRDLIFALRHRAAEQEIGVLFRSFEMCYAKILVSGVDDVIEATNFARLALIDFIGAHSGNEVDIISEMDADAERCFISCIHQMRKDMHFGTEIASEFLTEEVAERIKELMIEEARKQGR